MERFSFDPEAAAFRTRLIGNLELDPTSPESISLLEEWATRGERLVESGALDKFAWNREEAEVYAEAGAHEAALYVLKGALYEALHQDRNEETPYFRKRIRELGGNPDDLKEFEE